MVLLAIDELMLPEVAPDPSVAMELRAELRHERRVAIARLVGGVAMVLFGGVLLAFGPLFSGLSGIGASVSFILWGTVLSIQNAAITRATTRAIAKLAPPLLPQARLLLR